MVCVKERGSSVNSAVGEACREDVSVGRVSRVC